MDRRHVNPTTLIRTNQAPIADRGGGTFVCPNAYAPLMVDEPHYDANGYLLGSKTPTQRVLNQAWPYSDSKSVHARGLDDKPVDEQQLVYVRLELEHDGEVILEGRATRWTDEGSHVMVVVDDPRIPKPGMVWVRLHDTRPRNATDS